PSFRPSAGRATGARRPPPCWPTAPRRSGSSGSSPSPRRTTRPRLACSKASASVSRGRSTSDRREDRSGSSPRPWEVFDRVRSRRALMVHVALLVRLEAKPGKEAEVASFLKGGLAIVQGEPATTAWFAIQLGPRSFGIFDAFPDEAGRQ